MAVVPGMVMTMVMLMTMTKTNVAMTTNMMRSITMTGGVDDVGHNACTIVMKL